MGSGLGSSQRQFEVMQWCGEMLGQELGVGLVPDKPRDAEEAT